MILMNNKLFKSFIIIGLIVGTMIVINSTKDEMVFTLLSQVIQIFWSVFVSMLKILTNIFGLIIELVLR